MDLFATRYNHKCPTFISPVPDPLALEADALSLDWEGWSAYAYPHHQIMTKVLAKFRATQSCRLILVAPLWPTQLWFTELSALSSLPPVPLPLRADLLKQPQSRVFHHDPSLLSLHAWLVEKRS